MVSSLSVLRSETQSGAESRSWDSSKTCRGAPEGITSFSKTAAISCGGRRNLWVSLIWTSRCFQQEKEKNYRKLLFYFCEVKTAFKYVRSLINNHFSYFELSGKAGSRTMKGTFCILTLQYKRCVATINIQFWPSKGINLGRWTNSYDTFENHV